jgi:hypothetical protein
LVLPLPGNPRQGIGLIPCHCSNARVCGHNRSFSLRRVPIVWDRQELRRVESYGSDLNAHDRECGCAGQASNCQPLPDDGTQSPGAPSSAQQLCDEGQRLDTWLRALVCNRKALSNSVLTYSTNFRVAHSEITVRWPQTNLFARLTASSCRSGGSAAPRDSA